MGRKRLRRIGSSEADGPGEPGHQHQAEDHRVDDEPERFHPGPNVDREERQHDGPGQEGGAVVEAHHGEAARFGPPLGQARGVEGEADEDRDQRDRAQQAPSRQGVDENVDRTRGVEDEREKEVRLRVHL